VWVCTSFSPYAFLESTGKIYLYAVRSLLLSILETPSFPWECVIVPAVFRTHTFYIYFYGEAGKKLMIDNDVSCLLRMCEIVTYSLRVDLLDLFIISL
jgi:hypothetical protein